MAGWVHSSGISASERETGLSGREEDPADRLRGCIGSGLIRRRSGLAWSGSMC
ncbi:MAG: hypothetical protein ACE5EC_06535 [Phycisphaerae bacterium]